MRRGNDWGKRSDREMAGLSQGTIPAFARGDWKCHEKRQYAKFIQSCWMEKEDTSDVCTSVHVYQCLHLFWWSQNNSVCSVVRTLHANGATTLAFLLFLSLHNGSHILRKIATLSLKSVWKRCVIRKVIENTMNQKQKYRTVWTGFKDLVTVS